MTSDFVSGEPVLKAEGESHILTTLANAAWTHLDKDGECPQKLVPNSAKLARWMAECPLETQQKANDALTLAIVQKTEEPISSVDNAHARWHALLDNNGHLNLTALIENPDSETKGEKRDIEEVHRDWRRTSPSLSKGKGWERHPLFALVQAWLLRSTPVSRAHLMVKREEVPSGMESRSPVVLTAAPGILALANTPMEAVEVDGEPFVTATPDTPGRPRRVRWQVQETRQGDLFPAPKTLDGQASAGVMFDAAAGMNLSGDERSPLRADLLRVALAATCLKRAVVFTDDEGARFVGGSNTPENRARFNKAMWAVRSMGFEAKPGIFWPLVDSEPGEKNRLGPPAWWLSRRDGKAKPYRLTAAPFRIATKWGGLERTIAGLEGALTWGQFSSTNSKLPHLPKHLIAVYPGGPGPEVFVEWWRVLRLSGEPVEAHANPKGKHGRRYTRRIEQMRSAGYFVPVPIASMNNEAPIGDTVEIVRAVRGARNRTAGVIVRASARFCCAYLYGKQTQIPATKLIEAQESQ